MKKIFILLIILTFSACDEALFQENVPLGESVQIDLGEVEIDDNTEYFLELNSIPYHIQRFQEVQRQVENSPHGAAALFLVALHIYERYPFEGSKALISACGGAATKSASQASNSRNRFEGSALLDNEYARIVDQIQRYPDLANAYFKGASPDNDYSPILPYRIEFTRIQTLDKGFKYYVRTEGADSDRPIRVNEIDGKWRVEEYSSVLSGIKP